MRVAVLADIHGNLPALDAVLGDIDAVGVDAIVLNGDIATGPMPAAPEYPGLAQFIEENVLTVPSDAEALAVFSSWARAVTDTA